MTITINGTTGIAGVDGSAATPSVQGGDTNTGMFFPAADTIAFTEGGTEVMRIDSSGNVGIKTTSPTGNLTIGGSSPRLDFLETGGSAGFDNTTLIRDADIFAIQTRNGSTFVSNDYRITANASGALTHEWRIANTERMRIDSSGNLLFNSGYGSVATAYGCRAWVNFDGTTNTAGFCTIRGSGGVTSVADNGVGLYGINLAFAMPDVNYSTVLTPMQRIAGDSGGTVTNILTQTTVAITISNGDTSGNTYNDSSIICAAIFR